MNVRLCCDQQQQARGHLLDASPRRISVEFDESHAPAIGITETVSLEITVATAGRPVSVSARAISRSDRQRKTSYAFEPVDGDVEDLTALFQQRESFRVRTRDIDGIEAQVFSDAEDVFTSVELIDLSISGAALVVRESDSPGLVRCRRLMLVLRLPCDERALELDCMIRNRRLVGSSIVYGVEFVTSSEKEWVRRQEVVSSYVIARQRDILKARQARLAD